MTHDELDVYGFLKHYRDGLSWSNPNLIAISTRDAMDTLERYWREKIANEIEDLRVQNCRCDLDFIEKSCNLLHEAVLIASYQEEYSYED
jgi:hypothetical protein